MPKDPSQPKNPEESADAGAFDAVKAAEELATSLGMSSSSSAEGDQAYIATIERELEELNLLLDQKDAELGKAVAALAAAEAAHDDEIERATQRIQREEGKRLERRSRKMLLVFLEILDDMDRAIDSFERGGTPDAIIDGIELIRAAFMKKLGELGVSHSPSLGSEFDPNLHEGVTLMPVTNDAQHNRIVAVVREGYLIGDECLRPARVAVGKRG